MLKDHGGSYWEVHGPRDVGKYKSLGYMQRRIDKLGHLVDGDVGMDNSGACNHYQTDMVLGEGRDDEMEEGYSDWASNALQLKKMSWSRNSFDARK